jgi:hypothetical protein
VLVATSVKTETEYGLAFGGLLTSMVLIGLGVSGCRATVTPLMSQYLYNSRRTKKNGICTSILLAEKQLGLVFLPKLFKQQQSTTQCFHLVM